MTYLPHITIETGPSPSASVIWLHGLGANGHDFAPIVPELNLPESLPIRFIFPHAPEIPVTVNGGYFMPAWYDILELGLERKINHEHLAQATAGIQALIEREIEKGVPSKRILLIGFSQGGAVAYDCALQYEKPLAGILALSTYLISPDGVTLHSENQDIPVHLFHGSEDDMVPESMGITARDALIDMGLSPSYQRYHMAHEVCSKEVQDIRSVLIDLLQED